MKKTYTRRDFGRVLGTAALTGPLLAQKRAWAQQCQPNGAVKRLIVMFTPHGHHHPSWIPDFNGGLQPGELYHSSSDFSLAKPGLMGPGMLEALDPVKQKLIIADGIDFKNADNHHEGIRCMLTGVPNPDADAGNNGGSSIDQYIGAQLARAGCVTRSQVLYLGVNSDSGWGAQSDTRVSRVRAGVFGACDNSPVSAFRTLFGDANPAPMAPPGQIDRGFLRRRSILDFARGEMNTLMRKVSRDERLKLQQHHDAIRSLERRLESLSNAAAGMNGGVQMVQCDSPSMPWESWAQPVGDPCQGTGQNCNNETLMPNVARAQMDLLVAAMGCDATRVSTLQFSHTTGQPVFRWLDDPVTGASINLGHHTLSHEVRNEAGRSRYSTVTNWFSAQLAYLVEALDQRDDPVFEGSLLDNTLIMWTTEIGDGQNHRCEFVPFVFATGSDRIQTGRYLDYARGTDRANPTSYPDNGAAHQKLLVSVCQAMGLSDEVFGTAEQGIGALGGLLG